MTNPPKAFFLSGMKRRLGLLLTATLLISSSLAFAQPGDSYFYVENATGAWDCAPWPSGDGWIELYGPFTDGSGCLDYVGEPDGPGDPGEGWDPEAWDPWAWDPIDPGGGGDPGGNPGGGSKKVIVRDITYHPFGGVKSWIDGAHQTHTRVQDLDGRISGYNLGTTQWLLGMDAAGRITGQTESANTTNSGTYGYSVTDRLTSGQLPSASYGYTYDASGNRTSQTLGGTTRTYTLESTSNRLQSLTNPSQSLSYDPTGNLTQDGTNHYTYDGRGRLISASTLAGEVSYQINALGQRVRKTVTNNSVIVSDTFYHYDPSGQLIAESDATGTITREYIWLGDIPVAVMQ